MRNRKETFCISVLTAAEGLDIFLGVPGVEHDAVLTILPNLKRLSTPLHQTVASNLTDASTYCQKFRVV
jgi:hypothetical protein